MLISSIFKNFCLQNEKALTEGDLSAAEQKLYKEADKYCKVLLGRLSRGWGCVKGLGVALIVIGLGIAFVPQNAFESLDLTKFVEMLNIQHSV